MSSGATSSDSAGDGFSCASARVLKTTGAAKVRKREPPTQPTVRTARPKGKAAAELLRALSGIMAENFRRAPSRETHRDLDGSKGTLRFKPVGFSPFLNRASSTSGERAWPVRARAQTVAFKQEGAGQ